MDLKWIKNSPKIGQNGLKVDHNRTKNGPIRYQNGPKIDQKWTRIGSEMDQTRP